MILPEAQDHPERSPGTRRVRVGVIGLGDMGRRHAAAYSRLPGAVLVGIADHHEGRAGEVAAGLGCPGYMDHQDLLAHVEAVSIATSSASHFQVGLDCCRAGVHILMEKPLCLKVKEAETLVEEARARGVVLQPGHVERFNPAVAALFRLVEGRRVLGLEARRLGPKGPRKEHLDVILNLMIHDLDLALAMTGEEVREMAAFGACFQRPFLDLAVACLKFESGALASFSASYTSQATIRTLSVTAEGLFAQVDYLRQSLEVAREGQPLTPLPVPRAEPLPAQLGHFLDCVRDGRRPLVSGEDALASLSLAISLRDLATAIER